MIRALLSVILAVVLPLKGKLVPLRETKPTDEERLAYEQWEDENGGWGQYPSPDERYADAVEWREQMLELSLFTLIRWRLAIAWMPDWVPGCKHSEVRLLGRKLSRLIYPDLYGMRRKKARARKKVKA